MGRQLGRLGEDGGGDGANCVRAALVGGSRNGATVTSKVMLLCSEVLSITMNPGVRWRRRRSRGRGSGCWLT